MLTRLPPMSSSSRKVRLRKKVSSTRFICLTTCSVVRSGENSTRVQQPGLIGAQPCVPAQHPAVVAQADVDHQLPVLADLILFEDVPGVFLPEGSQGGPLSAGPGKGAVLQPQPEQVGVERAVRFLLEVVEQCGEPVEVVIMRYTAPMMLLK